MHRHPLAVVIALAAAVTLTACQPDEPSPSLSTATTSPSPASPAPTQEEPPYAEAEQVFLNGMTAQGRYALQGDYSEFPPELANYYAPEYLELVRRLFDQTAQTGIHGVGEGPKLSTAPLPGVSREGSEVAILTCVDARELTLVNGDGTEVGRGTLSTGTYFFKRFDGLLKIFTADVEEVTECPIV